MPAGCVNIKLINSPRKNLPHQIILECTRKKEFYVVELEWMS